MLHRTELFEIYLNFLLHPLLQDCKFVPKWADKMNQMQNIIQYMKQEIGYYKSKIMYILGPECACAEIFEVRG